MDLRTGGLQEPRVRFKKGRSGNPGGPAQGERRDQGVGAAAYGDRARDAGRDLPERGERERSCGGGQRDT